MVRLSISYFTRVVVLYYIFDIDINSKGYKVRLR